MKSIVEIMGDIESLKWEWDDIKQQAKTQSFISLGAMQDSLKKHLESARVSVEEYFLRTPSAKARCKKLLYKMLDVSENLKFSYLCPADYEESIDILGTIKMMDKRRVIC
jgi:hypothetical protein